MYKSKIIQVLKTFSPGEMKAFDRFVASPYFSTGRNTEGLFNILKEYYPDFESPDLERRLVFKKLFPGEKFVEKKFKNVTSALTGLAEEFHVHESIKQDPLKAEKLLASKYRDRGNDTLFYSTIKSLEKKVNTLLLDSVDAFTHQEELSKLKQEFYLGKNDFDRAFKEKSQYQEYLTLSFLISFLRRLRENEIIKDSYTTPVDDLLFNTVYEALDSEKILSGLRKQKYPMLWLLELYYYAFQSAKNLDDEKSFYKFKYHFNQNIKKFSRREKYYILNDFISFYIRNLNRGKSKYEREEFEVYKQIIEEDAYSASEDEFMIIVIFRNLLFVALSLKEYEWLERLLPEITSKLKPEYRENMNDFSMAHIEFAKQNFEKSLHYTIKINFDLFAYKFDVKNLLLMIYYELDLFDQAESLIDAYKHFISTTKEYPRGYLIQFNNFIKIYGKLFRAKSKRKRKDLELLEGDMGKMKLLSNRPWLKEKINQLKKY